MVSFIDDGTEKVDYECISRNIIDGNIMNMYLIITERNYGAINADNSSYNGCYTIRFSSPPHTLQSEFNI